MRGPCTIVLLILLGGGMLGCQQRPDRSRSSGDEPAVRETWWRVGGVRVHGWVYQPNGPAAGLVVLTHGYLANAKVLEQPFAVSLARQGFYVVSPDYPGYSASTGGVRQRMWPNGRSAGRAVLGAVVRRSRRAFFPGGWNVGLLGHSEGAVAVAEFAERHSWVKAVAYVSGPQNIALYTLRGQPKNVLLVTGQFDSITPMVPPTEARLLPWVMAPGTISGNYASGTARRLLSIAGRGHYDVIFGDESRQGVLSWFRAALMGDDAEPVQLASISLTYLAVGSLACLAVTALWATAAKFWFDPRAAEESHQGTLRAFLRGVVGIAATVPAAHAMFSYVALWGYSGECEIAAQLYGAAVGVLPALLLARATATTSSRFWPGPLASVRSIAFGVAAASLFCWLVSLNGGAYFDFSLGPPRRLIIARSIAMLPAILVWEAWLHLAAPTSPQWRGWNTMARGAASFIGLASGGTVVGGAKFATIVFVTIAQAVAAVPTIGGRAAWVGRSVCAVVVLAWLSAMFCPRY